MELQIFNNPSFGEVRVAGTSEQPLFCLADVCKAVGLKNPSSVKVRIDDADLTMSEVGVQTGVKADGTPSIQNVKMTFVNESGFYDVLLCSDAPHVKPFRKWVTSEVLPSIRKHGAYMTKEKIEEALLNPDTLIQLATTLKTEREKRELAESKARVAEAKAIFFEAIADDQAPKVNYYNNVLLSESTYNINQIASELGISAITLNKRLKEKKIQYKQGRQWLLYTKYRENGYTKTQTHHYTSSEGIHKTEIRTVWTEKGREFIHSILQ